MLCAYLTSPPIFLFSGLSVVFFSFFLLLMLVDVVSKGHLEKGERLKNILTEINGGDSDKINFSETAIKRQLFVLQL